MIVYPPAPNMSGRRNQGRRTVPAKKRQMVQWRQTNVEEGVVRVDENMLSKLIKKEPIEKYYKLDPEPFATGMFASVRRCRSLETGEVFAAKFASRLRYGEDCTKEIHHEIALLSLCSPSPRIIRLHDVYQTPKEFIIVMEYAPGGDMQTIIDDNLVPFETDVVKFIQHVVEGLAYLHHRKIAHLDIKPQNLVMMGEFPECDIKVCDFEISRVILEGSEIHEILGTPEYVAPEILHYEPITLAADMWSLGVTTYVLLTGFSPFGGETDQETFLNISKAQVDFPDELFEDVSENAKDFVRRLLIRKPSERMTAKECLRHPWLANNRKTESSYSKSSYVGGRGETEPRRVGCSSCPPSNQNLRKYLSKSREALFEKVLSQQTLLEKQKSERNLRKTTLLQQYNRTRRLCESQMSLVSKSRERTLKAQEAMMSHGVSRSREKLYGLKCLSKSQEVLTLYRSVLNLNGDEEEKVKNLPGLLKTLNNTMSDTSSLVNSRDSLTSSTISVVETGEDKENNNKETDESIEPVINLIRRFSSASVTLTPENEENKENCNKNTALENKVVVVEENSKDLVNNNVVESRRPSLLLPKSLPEVDVEAHSPAISTTDSITEGISTSESDISEEDACSLGPITGDISTEDDEPRFTVAQLVSAYNKHQEIVTKTSLEVTMSAPNVEEKIPPTLEKATTLKFPTGPNALRLFIPDIRISYKHKKRMPRKKTGIRPPSSFLDDLDTKEPSEDGDDVDRCKDEISSELVSDDKNDADTLTSRLGVEAPPPKYLRSESLSSETSKSSCTSTTWEEQKKLHPKTKSPSGSSIDLGVKQPFMSNVAKTVELFNNVISSTPRPNRKSFSSSQSPPEFGTDKIRRKSSPPTMKPCF